jgi:glycosyltransferase involved in cell wall biosynthesis
MSKTSNKLSVCMITTGFPVIDGDNSGIFIKKLIDQFGEEIKLKLLVPSNKEVFLTFPKYEVIRVKYFFRKWETLFYSARGLPQEIKNNPFILWQLPFFIISMTFYVLKHSKNVDIVHAHWLPMGMFGILPKILFGKNLIITLRGSDVKRMNSYWAEKFFAKIILKFCDSAVVVSKSFATQFKNQFPKLTTVYIPNGIDKVDVSNTSIDRKKNDWFEILYVGNLVQEKGILDLMHAFDELIYNGYKTRLTLIGNGDLKDLLIRWSMDNPDRIILRGTIPHDEVMNTMRKSDILVLPSYSEGRPNVVVEAMACYLPVVATKIDGIVELITNEESGLLFNPGDKNKLFDLLKNCIENKFLLKELAEKAYKRIQNESYSWKQVAEKYIDLYYSTKMD